LPALTTAYAGHGDTTAENIKAVLDVFLPDNLGMVYIPARVPRFQAGLKKVVSWLESEVGKDGTIPVPDLIEALLQRNRELSDEGKDVDDLVLVMLFDGEKEEDVALAQAAHEAGIRVVDLCAAGDDLLLDDADITFEEEPAPEPAPAEPQAEEPVAEPAEEEPPWEKPAGPAEAVAKAVRAAEAAKEAAAAGHPVVKSALTTTGLTVQITLNVPVDGLETIAAILAPHIVAAMGAGAQATIAEAEAVADEAGPATVSHIKEAPADGGEPPEGTKPYYYNRESGMYRPARGMARKTEDKVFLDAREIAAIKESKLLA